MPSNWKRLFTRNWGLKLASLILAMILWLALIGQEKSQSEKTLIVGLEIHNRPPHLLLVEPPPDFVNVIVRASVRVLPEITAVNVHVALDLTNATVVQTQYALNRNMVSLPAGAELKELSPSMVTLKLERRVEMTIPVEVDSHGELPDGYTLVSIECLPPEITIYGPESKIKEDLKAKTTLIDLSQITESMRIATDTILPDPALHKVDSETKVLVLLVIEKEEGAEGTDPPEKKDGAPVKKK
ncbi:MAG: YbbR-like domain-containing protein [Candidatus Aminicenantaceae bacterium]